MFVCIRLILVHVLFDEGVKLTYKLIFISYLFFLKVHRRIYKPHDILEVNNLSVLLFDTVKMCLC